MGWWSGLSWNTCYRSPHSLLKWFLAIMPHLDMELVRWTMKVFLFGVLPSPHLFWVLGGGGLVPATYGTLWILGIFYYCNSMLFSDFQRPSTFSPSLNIFSELPFLETIGRQSLVNTLQPWCLNPLSPESGKHDWLPNSACLLFVGFWNKIVLEHSHDHLFIYCPRLGCFCLFCHNNRVKYLEQR